jgi:hypothetical protein
MPNLPGSSPALDAAMFATMSRGADHQADQWKIYPCEVTPWTVIQKWFDEGSFVRARTHARTRVRARAVATAATIGAHACCRRRCHPRLAITTAAAMLPQAGRPPASPARPAAPPRVRAQVPYPDAQLVETILDAKAAIQPWVRLNRIVRDIPSYYIKGGINSPRSAPRSERGGEQARQRAQLPAASAHGAARRALCAPSRAAGQAQGSRH